MTDTTAQIDIQRLRLKFAEDLRTNQLVIEWRESNATLLNLANGKLQIDHELRTATANLDEAEIMAVLSGDTEGKNPEERKLKRVQIELNDPLCRDLRKQIDNMNRQQDRYAADIEAVERTIRRCRVVIGYHDALLRFVSGGG